MTIGRLSIRKLLGYGLLAICALAWLAVVLVPFLEVSLGQGAAIVTGLIVIGEGAFVVGVVLLGKDILNTLKTFITRVKNELQK